MKLNELRLTQQELEIREMSELFAAVGRYNVMLAEGKLDEAGVWNAIKGAAGKAVGGVKSANDAINRLGQLAQNTAPVQGFDSKVEDVLKRIGDANPKVADAARKYGEWAKKNPVKQGLIIGALTAIASVVTGPGGGAAAGAILRASNELHKGEKASTAVGKAAKTAVVGAAAGALAHATVADLGELFKVAKPILKQIPGVPGLTDYTATYIYNGRPLINVHRIMDRESISQYQSMTDELQKAIMGSPKLSSDPAYFPPNPQKASQLLSQIKQFLNSPALDQKIQGLIDSQAKTDAINKAARAAFDAAKDTADATNSQIDSVVKTLSTMATGAAQGAAAGSDATKAGAGAVGKAAGKAVGAVGKAVGAVKGAFAGKPKTQAPAQQPAAAPQAQPAAQAPAAQAPAAAPQAQAQAPAAGGQQSQADIRAALKQKQAAMQQRLKQQGQLKESFDDLVQQAMKH